MSDVNSLFGSMAARFSMDYPGLEDVMSGFEQLIDAKTVDELENALSNLQRSIQEQNGSISAQRQEIYQKLIDSVPYENQEALSEGLTKINDILANLYQSASADPDNAAMYANEAKQALEGVIPGLMDIFDGVEGAEQQGEGTQTQEGVQPRVGGNLQVQQASYSSDMITNLLNSNSNVSILLISMVVFLALADIDSAVIKTDATLITANQAYQKTLAQASSAMQALESVLPYPDPTDSSKTIDDLYSLYQIAYDKTKPDENLQKSLQPFTDWLKATDSTDMDALITGGFAAGDEAKLQTALNTAMNNTNQALVHVGATTMPLFSYTDDSSPPKPKLDPAKIQVQVSDLSSGMTAASSISQQENVIFQSHNETLNQHLQAAVNALSTYKSINQRIWAQ